MLHELTHNNYLKFGYNNKQFNLRQNPQDSFQLEYTSAIRTPLRFCEELQYTAKLVQKKFYGNKIFIFYSGGLDSELVLKSFVISKIPITAVTIRFTGGENDHDVGYTYNFCKENSIKQEILNISIEDFLSKNYLKYASPMQCCSPQFLPILWAMDQMGGIPVISGDCSLARSIGTNDFYFIEKEKYFSYYFHLIHQNKPGVPAFLQYTPELVLSYLKDETVVEYIYGKAKRLKLLSTKKFKAEVYYSTLGIMPRPVVNGYEYINELDMKYRRALEMAFPGSGTTISVPYLTMLCKLQPQTNSE